MSLARTVARTASLALVAGALTFAGAPAQAADPVVGSQTTGDSLFPNQGNGGYDAQHYDVDLEVDVATSPNNAAVGTTTFRDATTTMRATTTGAPLSEFSMDFQGSSGNLAAATLNVESVTVDGTAASFTRIENTSSNAAADKHKLVVTPVTPVDGTFTTVVKYSGRPVAHTDPDGSSEGWNNTTDGATFVNQPVGAMTAFPHNNTTRDKATWTFTIDIPSKLRTSNQAAPAPNLRDSAAVSNGDLVSRTPNGDGSRTTWVWDQANPMASMVAMISIGRYDMYTSSVTTASGKVLPEWSFIDPAIAAASQNTIQGHRAQWKSLIDGMESRYGQYPGSSIGVFYDVVPGAINYALETQDRSFFPSSATGRGTFVHELAHQWWGDSASPTSWVDLWISEGTATYNESQSPFEDAGSTTTTTETSLYNSWNGSSPTSAAWTTATAANTNAANLFGSHVYSRGAWLLEALRTAIGPVAFKQLQAEWLNRKHGSSGTTAEYVALAEEISGRSLTTFFQPWLYGTSGKAPWPAKFNLALEGPTSQVNGGDTATYTVSVRNTGKVAMAAGATEIKINLDDALDEARLDELPANVTQDQFLLTWKVPATAIGATSSVAVPLTVRTDPDKTGERMRVDVAAGTLGGTCVTCTSTVTIGTPPIDPAPAPTITGGTPTVGQPLTADTAGWAGGTTFAYQWMIDGTPVAGATNATWTPTAEVVGLPVTVKVTGTSTGHNATSRTSSATPVGVRATPTSAVPTIGGTPKIGSLLTVDPGTWQPGTVFTYQWTANGTNVSGATGPTYTPAVASQVGQTMAVTVTGTKPGYTTTSRASAPTAAVASGDAITTAPTPTTSTPVRVGTAVQGYTGDWDSGTTFTFRWLANGAAVSGATAAAFAPTSAQLGQSLVFEVTGTKPGVTPSVVRTAEPATVGEGVQTLQPTPTITGTGRADSPLTGVPGTWDTGTTRTYRWLVDGEAVADAVGTTYTPTQSQIGKPVVFEVTSTRTGYTTVVKTSAATIVTGAAQTLTPTPTIEGTPRVGAALTGVPGTWDDGTTLTYQWLADAAPIEGATGLSFTPTSGQSGSVITFAVTSTRAGYETVTRTSAATEAVAAGTLTLTPDPTIDGTPQVGVPLTAVPGTWDDGVTLSYQWVDGTTPIDGATASTYTPTAQVLGHQLTVRVTGAKPGYTSVTTTAPLTAEVAPGELAATGSPSILGTPKVGVELTAQTGTWDEGVTFGYQWFAGSIEIEDATDATFTPGPDLVGEQLKVAVSGAKPGYTTVTKSTELSDAVVNGTIADTPAPTILGTAKVGQELTAEPGAWSDGVDLTYQWLVDGDEVEGATELTYTPIPDDVGDTLTVEVTGTRSGYDAVTTTSEPTEPVVAGDAQDGDTPTITGTPKVGVELTATTGDGWVAGSTFEYAWAADGVDVDGADDSTFTPGVDQVGTELTVTVTGTVPGHSPTSRTSDPTDEVAPGDLTTTPTPVVAGVSIEVGRTATATSTAWDDGTTLAYQWRLNGAPVAGATKRTYLLPAGAVGRGLSVTITGSKPGYASVERTSTTTTVAPGTLIKRPKPVVLGSRKLWSTLRVQPATYDSGVTLSYAWYANGTKVGTQPTLRLVQATYGKQITVVVTVSKPGYTSVALRSAATEKVWR